MWSARATTSESKGQADDRSRQIELWRIRAEEVRVIATQSQVPSARAFLRALAAHYDRLADRAEVPVIKRR